MCIISSLTLAAIVLWRAFRRNSSMAIYEVFFVNPHYVAIASGLVFPLSCAMCYGLSLYLGHMDPVISYISDTVTDPPLSGLFGLLLTLSLLLFSVVACMRHALVREACSRHPELCSARVLMSNSVSGWMAACTVLAMMLVAHFQVHTTVLVHAIGAFVGIGSAVIYFCCQAVCSKAMVPLYTSRAMLYLRVTLAVLTVVLYLSGVAAGALSITQYTGTMLHRWTPEDGGYAAHAVSAVCEWFLALVFSAYFFTFAAEFRRVSLRHAKLVLPDCEPTTTKAAATTKTCINQESAITHV